MRAMPGVESGAMPNAQTHLAAACDLFALPEIRSALPWLAQEEAQSSFLLGTISPDVRAISGNTREATHFFAIPPDDPRPPQDVMLAEWPQLRDAPALGAAHAAFVAGYMTHLIMDQTWVEMVVMPGLFIDGTTWGTRHPNWRVYCILMTYLEYRAADGLPAGTGRQLAKARPDGWLPFVADHYLAEWGGRISHMIEQGGARLVSRALAQTCNLAPEEMEAIVLSEDRMSADAYWVVPRECLLAFEAESARRSGAAVMGYLKDTAFDP